MKKVFLSVLSATGVVAQCETEVFSFDLASIALLSLPTGKESEAATIHYKSGTLAAGVLMEVTMVGGAGMEAKMNYDAIIDVPTFDITSWGDISLTSDTSDATTTAASLSVIGLLGGAWSLQQPAGSVSPALGMCALATTAAFLVVPVQAVDTCTSNPSLTVVMAENFPFMAADSTGGLALRDSMADVTVKCGEDSSAGTYVTWEGFKFAQCGWKSGYQKVHAAASNPASCSIPETVDFGVSPGQSESPVFSFDTVETSSAPSSAVYDMLDNQAYQASGGIMAFEDVTLGGEIMDVLFLHDFQLFDTQLVQVFARAAGSTDVCKYAFRCDTGDCLSTSQDANSGNSCAESGTFTSSSASCLANISPARNETDMACGKLCTEYGCTVGCPDSVCAAPAACTTQLFCTKTYSVCNCQHDKPQNCTCNGNVLSGFQPPLNGCFGGSVSSSTPLSPMNMLFVLFVGILARW